MSECPLCGLQPKRIEVVNGQDAYEVECDKCGRFYVTTQAIIYLKNNVIDKSYKISSYTRECFLFNRKIPFITTGKVNGEIKDSFYITVDEILNEKFPYLISERIDKTLVNFSKMAEPGEWVYSVADHFYPLAYSKDKNSWEYIIGSLIEGNLVEVEKETTVIDDRMLSVLRITPKGWNRVAEIERGMVTSQYKQAFVAMWFDKSMEYFWQEGFREIGESLGLIPVRVDKKEHNEKICDVIISEIRKSKFLIADFTGDRGGVYFEAGFAKGLGIPVIFTCQKGEWEKKLHFDTRQYNHIIWENIEDLKTKLKNRIQATIPLN